MARAGSQPFTRAEAQRIARRVWWDAGADKADAVRASFVRVMKGIGHTEAACPKSWRHGFATLLQDANVDPPADAGPPADERGGPGQDGQLHAHPARDAARADRAGASPLA